MSESKIVLTIDDKLKNEAEDLFASLGLNLETAISMFLTKAINEGGIPFEVKQTKFVESPDFISSHFTIKSAVYEINKYIKDRFNEEPSFYLEHVKIEVLQMMKLVNYSFYFLIILKKLIKKSSRKKILII